MADPRPLTTGSFVGSVVGLLLVFVLIWIVLVNTGVVKNDGTPLFSGLFPHQVGFNAATHRYQPAPHDRCDEESSFQEVPPRVTYLKWNEDTCSYAYTPAPN
jgi:hypothetical protein